MILIDENGVETVIAAGAALAGLRVTEARLDAHDIDFFIRHPEQLRVLGMRFVPKRMWPLSPILEPLSADTHPPYGATQIGIIGTVTEVGGSGTGDSVEQIAKACHEVNRTFCNLIGEAGQLPWGEAPQWQRDSACAGVKYHLNDPEADASSSHLNWMKDKLADDWKYGPVKDAELKEHPWLVPFSNLPVRQQWKDHFFKTIVNALGE